MRAVLAPLFALVLPAAAQEGPKPTPHHVALKALVGTWDTTVKLFTAPGKPPAESKGVEVNRIIAGGFWLQTEFTGHVMGQPFEGHGLFGYDTAAQRHVGTWVDNSDTWPANMTGTCTDGCREVTSTFQGRGMDGKLTLFKEVSVMVNADHRTFTMFVQGPDGAFRRLMEMAYTRRK